MTRLYLCETTDIKKKHSRVFELENGLNIVVFHTKKGFFALENRCPHAGAALNDGMIKRDVLMCIWHGWKFNLQTGECLNQPQNPARTFPLYIENNALYIAI